MLAVLLSALLALVSVPRTQAVWLGRLDPQQVTAALLGWHRPGGLCPGAQAPPVGLRSLGATLPVAAQTGTSYGGTG